MAQTVSIILNCEDRKCLEEIVGDRSRALKHIQRAKIVLFSTERLPRRRARLQDRTSAVMGYPMRFSHHEVPQFGEDHLYRSDGLARDVAAPNPRKQSRVHLDT